MRIYMTLITREHSQKNILQSDTKLVKCRLKEEFYDMEI